MKQTEHDGPLLAIEPSADAMEQPTLTMIDDLLKLVSKRPGGGGGGPALHSAAANFLSFIGATAQETPIYLLETKLELWVRHLEVARYTKETLKSYRYCVNLLVKTAREHGWEPPPAIMPPCWAPVFELASAKEVKSIVRFAVLIGKTPSTFTEDDLRSWSQQRVQTGRSFSGCKRHLSAFRSLLSMPKLIYLRPLVQVKPKGYGVPLREMYPGLRSEIEGLVTYLTDDFELDRDGPSIRKASAEDLLGIMVRLTGFVQNVRSNPPVESLAALLTVENISGYVKWAINHRKVQGESLVTGLTRVHSSLNNHPKYAGLDLNWLPGIIKKLPRSSQSEVDRRKEKKYISYDLADAIPGKIRTDRNRAKNPSPSDLAASLRDELMMLWLVILPWRQRNLRECRISGGPRPNLFCEPTQKLSAWTRPKWLEQQEKVDATKPVWQIYFSPSETKSGNAVSAFLPKELVVLLEEYLSHRSALLPADQPDPGTLFLTNKGNPMDHSTIRDRIEELTSRYAGVAVNPHLFRDIVAYEWLKAHPEDFLTLSKLLWHKSVEYTLNVYGSRFNESTGIARMDDWRPGGRKAA